MPAAISSLFPRHRRQTDLECPNCEVNLSKEKGQTYNQCKHHRNEKPADNEISMLFSIASSLIFVFRIFSSLLLTKSYSAARKSLAAAILLFADG